MLIDRFKSILQELYEEPSDEIIMGSLLFDDTNEMEIDIEINESPAAPENRKKKKN